MKPDENQWKAISAIKNIETQWKSMNNIEIQWKSIKATKIVENQWILSLKIDENLRKTIKNIENQP